LPVAPALPWKSGDKVWQLYTSILSEEDLVDDDLLRATPATYQAVVQKDYELRVTVVGNYIFCAKIYSQDTETGRLDWRKSYHEVEMEPSELPEDIAALCRTLMRRLDIVFGCFDFAVTPEGEHVFLEVNQMGQFLFIER